MGTFYFTINYYFKGDGWTDELKEAAKECYMDIRSKWVDIVNPLIPLCNDCWEMNHPELKGVKLEGQTLEHYDRYMAETLDNQVLTDRGKFPGNDLFYGRCNPDYADFRLVYRKDENMFVDYDMTPVK